MDPVGMTNASTTNARKMNARMKATRIDSIVSLTLVPPCPPSLALAGLRGRSVSWAVGDGSVLETDDG